MSDGRVRRITEVVKAYDSRLFAHRAGSGVIQIHRKADHLAAADAMEELPDLARHQPQFILSLTHDWSPYGQPAEWGLDPLLRKLSEMDSWRDDRMGSQMRADRERRKLAEERARRNNYRALAMDMRKDFAKATNDINTSTLEKLDPRRMENGNCK